MKRLLLVLFCLLVFSTSVFGAATCKVEADRSGPYLVLVFEWLAHTDGAVASGTCDKTTDAVLGGVSGIVLGAKFEPHATNVPTDLYDVVLNTTGGADVLFGSGANQTNDDSVTTQWQSPLNADSGQPTIYQEDLDLVITNAGSGNEGKLFVIIREYKRW